MDYNINPKPRRFGYVASVLLFLSIGLIAGLTLGASFVTDWVELDLQVSAFDTVPYEPYTGLSVTDAVSAPLQAEDAVSEPLRMSESDNDSWQAEHFDVQPAHGYRAVQPTYNPQGE